LAGEAPADGIFLSAKPRGIGSLHQNVQSGFRAAKQSPGEKSKLPIPADDLFIIQRLGDASPAELGLIDAADNWVVETFHEASRLPSTSEWRG